MNRRKFLQNGAMAIVAASVAPAAVLAIESPTAFAIGGIMGSNGVQIATLYEYTDSSGTKTWAMKYTNGYSLPMTVRNGKTMVLEYLSETQA